MSVTLVLQSSLTDRYQTTVPGPVRKVLRLGKRSKLRYELQADGTVTLRGTGAGDREDPVLAKFLEFLVRDMEQHPERVQAVRPSWVKRMRSLVRGVRVDRNAALKPEDE